MKRVWVLSRTQLFWSPHLRLAASRAEKHISVAPKTPAHTVCYSSVNGPAHRLSRLSHFFLPLQLPLDQALTILLLDFCSGFQMVSHSLEISDFFLLIHSLFLFLPQPIIFSHFSCLLSLLLYALSSMPFLCQSMGCRICIPAQPVTK